MQLIKRCIEKDGNEYQEVIEGCTDMKTAVKRLKRQLSSYSIHIFYEQKVVSIENIYQFWIESDEGNKVYLIE